jgi:hypothetical protein
MNLRKEGLCQCECHQREGLRHSSPCCELTYSIYLNAQGDFINDKWVKAKHKFNEWVNKEIITHANRKTLLKELNERKFPNPDESIWECAKRLKVKIK